MIYFQFCQEETDTIDKKYKDRAEERRVIHGVDPVNAKTVTASVDQAIGQLLQL